MIDILTNENHFLYDDAFEIANGYIYKVVGDLHPPSGVISLLEYVPWPSGRRFGFEKTFDFLIPQLNRRVAPIFPQWFIAPYGRAFEVVPLSDIRRRFEPEVAARNVAAHSTDGERNCSARSPSPAESHAGRWDLTVLGCSTWQRGGRT